MSLMRQSLRYLHAALGALFFVRWHGHPGVSELRSLSGEADPTTVSPASPETPVSAAETS